MSEKTSRLSNWLAFIAWVIPFVHLPAQSPTPQPTVFFKVAVLDEASKGADKVLIETGSMGDLRRFEVSRLSLFVDFRFHHML